MSFLLWMAILIGIISLLFSVIATYRTHEDRYRQVLPSAGIALSMFHLLSLSMIVQFFNSHPDEHMVMFLFIVMCFQMVTMLYVILGSWPPVKLFIQCRFPTVGAHL